jgi:hypothetical protein
VELVDKLPIGMGGQLAGSYCIREGSNYTKEQSVFDVCQKSKGDCGPVDEHGEPK